MGARIPLYCFVLALLIHADKILCLNGRWELLVKDAGIASMHSAVTRYGTVVLLDRQITVKPSDADTTSCVHGVPDSGHCIVPYSGEYDPVSNTVRPLDGIMTDPWCSSGQFDPNGTLIQTGGYNYGSHRVRRLEACPPGRRCQWIESGDALLKDPRWYATNQILPDGRQIVVGGREAPNFEYVPPRRHGEEPTFLSMLTGRSKYTTDQAYYPFLHLLPDGTVFVLAGTDSVALNLKTNRPTRSCSNAMFFLKILFVCSNAMAFFFQICVCLGFTSLRYCIEIIATRIHIKRYKSILTLNLNLVSRGI